MSKLQSGEISKPFNSSTHFHEKQIFCCNSGMPQCFKIILIKCFLYWNTTCTIDFSNVKYIHPLTKNDQNGKTLNSLTCYYSIYWWCTQPYSGCPRDIHRDNLLWQLYYCPQFSTYSHVVNVLRLMWEFRID